MMLAHASDGNEENDQHEDNAADDDRNEDQGDFVFEGSGDNDDDGGHRHVCRSKCPEMP